MVDYVPKYAKSSILDKKKDDEEKDEEYDEPEELDEKHDDIEEPENYDPYSSSHITVDDLDEEDLQSARQMRISTSDERSLMREEQVNEDNSEESEERDEELDEEDVEQMDAEEIHQRMEGRSKKVKYDDNYSSQRQDDFYSNIQWRTISKDVDGKGVLAGLAIFFSFAFPLAGLIMGVVLLSKTKEKGAEKYRKHAIIAICLAAGIMLIQGFTFVRTIFT